MDKIAVSVLRVIDFAHSQVLCALMESADYPVVVRMRFAALDLYLVNLIYRLLDVLTTNASLYVESLDFPVVQVILNAVLVSNVSWADVMFL